MNEQNFAAATPLKNLGNGQYNITGTDSVSQTLLQRKMLARLE